MKLLIDINDLDKYTEQDKLPCECLNCKQKFYLTKNKIRRSLRGERPNNFCSQQCSSLFRKQLPKASKSSIEKTKYCNTTIKCQQCKKEVDKYLSKNNKSKYHFCSLSCNAKWYNTHKTKSFSRSKLELWLEKQLPIKFPNLSFSFNNRTEINSELDIYIPSLKLAFELNGIVHYEPIYGREKLQKIQNNDNRKFQACLEKNIELAIINTNGFKNFKENKALIYLNIICDIINKKLSL